MAASGTLKAGLRHASKWVFAVADFPFTPRPGPRILIYHQIAAGMGRQMEVSREAFEYQLGWLLDNGSIVTLDEALERAGEPESHKLFVLTFDDGYRDVYEQAFPLLREAEVPFLVYVTTGPVEAGRGEDEEGRDAPLSWQQLTSMAGAGATIGSHTHTHPDLRRLSHSEIERELEESDALIMRNLGIKSEHFCYPYGYWSEAAHPLVADRYRTATLGGGPAVTAATDPHLIHRVPIQLSDTKLFFKRKMTSGMVLEEKVRRRISGYQGI
ncbi:MAG: hypothetical protein DWQ40_07935 [Actinobacteria bacterium]|nr:MAG: hypothetical protein DWQ40_07935 [Actinomycetota bacterium]